MHDVISGSGVFYVTSIDVHCIAELITPGACIYPHGIHVYIDLDQHTVDHRIKLYKEDKPWLKCI